MPFKDSREPLVVITAEDGQCAEIADLRQKDLLELTIYGLAGGADDQKIFRLFSSFNSHEHEFHLVKRDGYLEYWRVSQVKKIRLLARDANVAFDILSSLDERYEHLKELLQAVASRTGDFAQDIKGLCDRSD